MGRINVKQKGSNGEREVCTLLNNVVKRARYDHGVVELNKEDLPFQRNQNQTAVGGDDISCPFPLSIEVKRVEKVAINTWWKQCVTSADRRKFVSGIYHLPVLFYRQNNKKWRVVTEMKKPSLLDTESENSFIVEFKVDDFLEWFYYYYKQQLRP